VQLTIDNLDGLGAVAYTAAIDASEPFAIERTLNAPSILKALLCLAGQSPALAIPARRGRVVVTSAAGATLFTGYLATEPAPVYAGEASHGAVYRYALSAVSDEWLLDKLSPGFLFGPGLGIGSGNLLAALASQLATQFGEAALETSSLAAGQTIGVFEPSPEAATWSAQAGALASSAYSAYTALGGSLGLSKLTSVQHILSDGDGSLALDALKISSVRELANDVTVTGAEEPSAYWTELFLGDGATTVFDLLGQPDAPNAGKVTLLADSFNASTLNPQTWQITDPGAHLSLSGAGLTCSGGNGLDGQTTLIAWNPLELGGTLVLELGTTLLSIGSTGVIAGLYAGLPVQANCLAGFNIRQSDAQTLATPLVNGVETGTSLTVLPGHAYTLRLRLHCPEMLRLQQIFYALTGTSTGDEVQQFGGGDSSDPLSLVFEVRDEGLASNTPVTILYDGALASAPAQASLVLMNSLNLVASIGSLNVASTGSCWIRSTSTTGTSWTRLIGTLAEGVDCSVTSSATGHVTFFNGRVPAAGEIVAVSYRGRQRAVARLADPTSLAAEAAGRAPGTARWLGHITQPPARCQQDCENAAQAILTFATNRAAALSGSYLAVNPSGGDIWPGDTLAFPTNGYAFSGIVRRVTVSTQGESPEALTYHIAFANDWAEGIGLKLSETLEAGVILPETALDLTTGAIPSIPPHVLANLQQITIAPASASLSIDAGLDPPAGGGFEVRRRDGGWGTGLTGSLSGGLVLRSPVRGFSIPTSAAQETFYLRMYDASTPPLYSRYSAAIANNLPTS
jgi:hypothetical protein